MVISFIKSKGRQRPFRITNPLVFFFTYLMSTGLFLGICHSEAESIAGSPGELDADFDMELNESGMPILTFKRHPGDPGQFSVITEKNLFHQERIFMPGEGESDQNKEEPKQPAVELPNLKLVGTINISQRDAFAFIIDTKDQKQKDKIQKFKIGDWFGDYRIENIDSDRVTFKRGDELAILKLRPSESAAKKPPKRPNEPQTPAGKKGDTARNPQSQKRQPKNPNVGDMPAEASGAEMKENPNFGVQAGDTEGRPMGSPFSRNQRDGGNPATRAYESEADSDRSMEFSQQDESGNRPCGN